MKYDTFGCQLLMKEKTSKQEILKALALLLTKLEDEQDIEEYANIHISFDIYKNDEKQVLVSKADPTKKYSGFNLQPQSNHKTITKLPDGSKKITYDRNVNFDELEKTINDARKNKRENVPQVSMSVKEYEASLRGQPVSKPKVEEPMKPIEKPKSKAQLLQEILSKKLGVEIEELPNYIFSVETLVDEDSILDFIDVTQMPIEKKIILVRYKDQHTGRVSHNEAYSIDLVLIK